MLVWYSFGSSPAGDYAPERAGREKASKGALNASWEGLRGKYGGLSGSWDWEVLEAERASEADGRRRRRRRISGSLEAFEVDGWMSREKDKPESFPIGEGCIGHSSLRAAAQKVLSRNNLLNFSFNIEKMTSWIVVGKSRQTMKLQCWHANPGMQQCSRKLGLQRCCKDSLQWWSCHVSVQ